MPTLQRKVDSRFTKHNSLQKPYVNDQTYTIKLFKVPKMRFWLYLAVILAAQIRTGRLFEVKTRISPTHVEQQLPSHRRSIRISGETWPKLELLHSRSKIVERASSPLSPMEEAEGQINNFWRNYGKTSSDIIRDTEEKVTDTNKNEEPDSHQVIVSGSNVVTPTSDKTDQGGSTSGASALENKDQSVDLRAGDKNRLGIVDTLPPPSPVNTFPEPPPPMYINQQQQSYFYPHHPLPQLPYGYVYVPINPVYSYNGPQHSYPAQTNDPYYPFSFYPKQARISPPYLPDNTRVAIPQSETIGTTGEMMMSSGTPRYY